MTQSTDDALAAMAHYLEQLERRTDAERTRAETAEKQLAELTQIVGTETPIGALTLAETWHAEKQLYMERIEQLTLAMDEQKEEIAALATLRTLARAVCECLARDDNNVTPDTSSALRQLGKAVQDV